MQYIVMMRARTVGDIPPCHHLLHHIRCLLRFHRVRTCGILLARFSRLPSRSEVLLQHLLLRDDERLRLRVQIHLRIMRQPREPVHVPTLLVVLRARKLRIVPVHLQVRCCIRDGIQVRVPIRPLIHTDHPQTLPADGAIDQERTRILFAQTKCLVHVLHMIDVTEAQPRECRNMRELLARPIEDHRHREDRHSLLLYFIIRRLDAHYMSLSAILFRKLTHVLVVFDHSHQLIHANGLALVGMMVLQDTYPQIAYVHLIKN